MNVTYLIIGAGPGGLQLGYFLHKHNYNYLIIEKNATAGSFFSTFPHGNTLISINKKHTGSDNGEFNLRHDWNSLLNDEGLLFTNYSDRLYPSKDDLYRYLNDFAKSLNIQYDTEVLKISKSETDYSVLTNKGVFTCQKCIIATGLTPNKTSEYHYGNLPKDFFNDKTRFINKKVLIIGSGNSAYEIANLLVEHASNIIISAKQFKIASETHYAGHLRSVYLPFLDTFTLKSLNGIHARNIFTEKSYIKKGDKYFFPNLYEGFVSEYDYVFFCTGYQPHCQNLFDFPVSMDISTNNKYPLLNYQYESINNSNLFFIGTCMHGKDYQKSAGGFIHGFRYLIRYLYYNLSSSIVKHEFYDINSLIDLSFERIKISSSLYQMYGIMGDCIFYCLEKNKFIYIEDVTLEWLQHYFVNKLSTDFLFLTLSYGIKPHDFNDLIANFTKYEEKFLHARIELFQKENNKMKIMDRFNFDEQIILDFSHSKYREKLERIIMGQYSHHVSSTIFP